MSPLMADCVAKVFLTFGRETLTNDRARTSNNDFKRTDAPIRLLQISISQSLLGDFCNTIDTFRTSAHVPFRAAVRGIADNQGADPLRPDFRSTAPRLASRGAAT